MFVIVGLGNPGLKYRHTRHNAGFDAIDYIADKYGIPLRGREDNALTGKGIIDGQQVLLVKPQTFMNNSGESVGPLLSYYRLDAEKDLIVLSDDVTLDLGKIRIRGKGSSGGHNGLKSIIAHTHTENFMRIRLGVGAPRPGEDMVRHVLRRMSPTDRKIMQESYENAAQALLYMMGGHIEQAMNRYN